MPSAPSSSRQVTVVVDTREQEPYGFNPRLVAQVRRALPAGDYSVAGLEETIAVERKTLEDFVNTVMRVRGRFYRELRRLHRYRRACVVVEANLSDVLAGRYRSDAHPNAIVGSSLAIMVDFGIPVYFCSNRQVACKFVEGFLLRAAEGRSYWQTLG
jgi:DNA excision repair protein ERCC-4